MMNVQYTTTGSGVRGEANQAIDGSVRHIRFLEREEREWKAFDESLNCNDGMT